MLSVVLLPIIFGTVALAVPSKYARAARYRVFPSLIIPVDKRTPDTVIGTQFSGDVEHSIHTHVSFDVPVNNADSCRICFYINTDAPRHLWGVPPYRFNVSSTAPTLDKDSTTWKNAPTPLAWVAQFEVDHTGNVTSHTIPIECAKGQTQQFVLYPDNPNRDFGFTWYELDYPHGITLEMD